MEDRTGSATVFINNLAAIRLGDRTQHCGGFGQMIEGSPNVIIGDDTSSGGTGSAPPGQNASPASGGGGGASSATAQSTTPSNGSASSTASSQSASGSSSSSQQSQKPDDAKVYVINTQLTSPGGVALGGEQVVLLKAGTDEHVAGPFDTDAQGGFAAVVPDNVAYDVKMLDTGHSGGGRANDDGPVQHHLYIAFFEAGVPVAGEAVMVTRPDGSRFAAVLDGDGILEVVAEPGEYQVSLRDQTVHAHTLALADLDQGGSHYEFAVPPPAHDFETARANRYHPDGDEGAG